MSAFLSDHGAIVAIVCAACAVASDRGVAKASESGSTASATTAKVTSVCCQPNALISRTAIGENRN